MAPIGVFDSGYGGLTVLRSIVSALPEYDYCYLGDNARAPYGNRSFDSICNGVAIVNIFELQLGTMF